MRRLKDKSYDSLPYVIIFLSLLLFQINRILQIKSPVSNIYLFDSSYLLYGLVLFLVPIYIVLFVYIPSLLVVRISIRFATENACFYLAPIKIPQNKYLDQIPQKSNFRLLCVMRC